MSLSLTDVANYLESQFVVPNNLTVAIQVNRLQDTPDAAISFTTAGGGLPIMDGAFETCHVRFRVRDTNDALAETLALSLHEFWSGHEGSFAMGSTYVMSVMPSSGPPQYFDRDVDNRTTYMGTYQFYVAV